MDARTQAFGAEVDAKKQHSVDTAIASLRRDLDHEKSKYSNLLNDFTEAQTRLDMLGFIEERGIVTTPIEPLLDDDEGEAVAMAVLSDVHPFTRIRPETVNGLNEFNPDVCKFRVERFFRGLVRLTNIERVAQNVKRLILVLGGDIIGNMIHDELKETNYGTPQEEVLFMLELIESGVEYLLEHGGFDEIKIVGVHGNHDRDTKKKQFENQAEHALTWTLYHVLKRDYERSGDPVTVEIAKGYHHIIDVFGRRVRIHHGDSIKYSGGVGGPTVGINKAIAGWNQTDPVHLDVFGHLHTSLSDQRFFANGSVCGYSTYALANKLPYESPRQWFVLLDKDRWITAQKYIYL
jgi:hypothetical protein